LKLYSHPLSGHAHRVRLFLSLVNQPYELVDVDLATGAHKKPEFLALNCFGQVPVLDDDGVIVTDSNAILVYLAKKLGKTDWLPESPKAAAAVQRWLSVAAGQIAYGPGAARLITLFHAPFGAEEVIGRAHALLKVMDQELSGRDWIASPSPTIADIANYGYVARAPEGNVDLSAYPHVARWLKRIEALPGFVEFAKSSVGLAA
jgi:glutathione S-transferase